MSLEPHGHPLPNKRFGYEFYSKTNTCLFTVEKLERWDSVGLNWGGLNSLAYDFPVCYLYMFISSNHGACTTKSRSKSSFEDHNLWWFNLQFSVPWTWVKSHGDRSMPGKICSLREDRRQSERRGPGVMPHDMFWVTWVPPLHGPKTSHSNATNPDTNLQPMGTIRVQS